MATAAAIRQLESTLECIEILHEARPMKVIWSLADYNRRRFSKELALERIFKREVAKISWAWRNPHVYDWKR